MERKRKYNQYLLDATHEVPVRSRHRAKKEAPFDASLPTLQGDVSTSPDLVSEETLCDRGQPPVNDDSDATVKGASPVPIDDDSPSTYSSSDSSDAETSEDEEHAFEPSDGNADMVRISKFRHHRSYL